MRASPSSAVSDGGRRSEAWRFSDWPRRGLGHSTPAIRMGSKLDVLAESGLTRAKGPDRYRPGPHSFPTSSIRQHGHGNTVSSTAHYKP